MDLTEVRALADLARAEEWGDLFSAVDPTLQEKRENVRRILSNKLVTLSPYLALVGLAGIVAAVVAFRRRDNETKKSVLH